MTFYRTLIAAMLLIGLGACEKYDSLAEIQARGELVVVSRNSPTTYYLGKNGPTGFEYALTELLAKELGVTLRLETVFSLPDIFQQLERNEADIAAAGLTLTDQRVDTFPATDAYYRMTPQVIYVAGQFRPRSIFDMQDMSLAVLKGSIHAELLR